MPAEHENLWIREAVPADIPQLVEIRNAVNENRLFNPDLIKVKDYEDFLFNRGRGWVALTRGMIIGFAIADRAEHNVWALFLLPAFEKQGIGKKLHDKMLDWYFAQTNHSIWLSTAPQTRAETFYRKAGWVETGRLANGETRFEMTASCWKTLQNLQSH